MPAPGHANNPGGVNGLYDESEHPYGQIKRLTQLTQAAPVAEGEAGSATAAPRRAQRQATRPAHAVATGPAAVPTAPPLPQETQAETQAANDASAWAALAAHPEASPLVQLYAQEAAAR